MGRPKRLYPLGRYRLRVPKDAEADKAYPVVLEYTWNRQIIRKTTNVFAKIADWNQNGNQGRGELRVSYGSEYKRLNQLLLSRVERIDSRSGGWFSCGHGACPTGSRKGFRGICAGTPLVRLLPESDRPEPIRKREELYEYLPDLSAGDQTGFLSARCNLCRRYDSGAAGQLYYMAQGGQVEQ